MADVKLGSENIFEKSFINAQLSMLGSGDAKKNLMCGLLKNHASSNMGYAPPFSFSEEKKDGVVRYDLVLHHPENDPLVNSYLSDLTKALRNPNVSNFEMQITVKDFVALYATSLATDKLGRVNSVLERQYKNSFLAELSSQNIAFDQIIPVKLPYSVMAYPVLRDADLIGEKMINASFGDSIKCSESATKKINEIRGMGDIKKFINSDYFSQPATKNIIDVCHTSIVKDFYNSLGSKTLVDQIEACDPISVNKTSHFASLYNSDSNLSTRISGGGSGYISPYKFLVSEVSFVTANPQKFNANIFGTNDLIVPSEEGPGYALVKIDFASNPKHSVADMPKSSLKVKISTNSVDAFLQGTVNIIKDPALSFDEKVLQINSLEARYQKIGEIALKDAPNKRKMFEKQYSEFVSGKIDEFVGKDNLDASQSLIYNSQGTPGKMDVIIYQNKDGDYIINNGSVAVSTPDPADAMAIARLATLDFSKPELAREVEKIMRERGESKEEVFVNFLQKNFSEKIQSMLQANPRLQSYSDGAIIEITTTIAKAYAKIYDREFDAYVMTGIKKISSLRDIETEKYNQGNIIIKEVSNALLKEPIGYSVELPTKERLYFSSTNADSLQKIIDAAGKFNPSDNKSVFSDLVAKNYGPQEVANLEGTKVLMAREKSITDFISHLSDDSLKSKFELMTTSVCERYTSAGLAKELETASSITEVSNAIKDYLKILPADSALISYFGNDGTATGAKTWSDANSSFKCFNIELPGDKRVFFSKDGDTIHPLGVTTGDRCLEFSQKELKNILSAAGKPVPDIEPGLGKEALAERSFNNMKGVIECGVDFKTFSAQLAKEAPIIELPKDFKEENLGVTGIVKEKDGGIDFEF